MVQAVFHAEAEKSNEASIFKNEIVLKPHVSVAQSLGPYTMTTTGCISPMQNIDHQEQVPFHAQSKQLPRRPPGRLRSFIQINVGHVYWNGV